MVKKRRRCLKGGGRIKRTKWARLRAIRILENVARTALMTFPWRNGRVGVRKKDLALEEYIRERKPIQKG